LVLLFCQQVNYFFYIHKGFIYIIYLNINLALKSIENYIENTTCRIYIYSYYFLFILAYFIIYYIKTVAKYIYIIKHNRDIRC